MYPVSSKNVTSICASKEAFWNALEEYVLPADKRDVPNCEIESRQSPSNPEHKVYLRKEDNHICFRYADDLIPKS